MLRNVCQVALAAVAMAGLLCVVGVSGARAQNYVSLVSGDTSSGTAGTLNLTTILNGVVTYSNGVTDEYSTSYDSGTLLLGATSTPTATDNGTPKPFMTTAQFVTDSSLDSYTGALSYTAGNGTTYTTSLLAPYANQTGLNQAPGGYYRYSASFTVSGLANEIAGFANTDNELQDIILDYGTANAQALSLSVLSGEIRTTNNNPSRVSFSANGNLALAAGSTHTISFVTANYQNGNGSGTPTDFRFGLTASDVPEPSSVALSLFALLPLLGRVAVRRRVSPR